MRALALSFDKQKIAECEVAEPVLRHADYVRYRILGVGVCGTNRAISHLAIGCPPKSNSRKVAK